MNDTKGQKCMILLAFRHPEEFQEIAALDDEELDKQVKKGLPKYLKMLADLMEKETNDTTK